MAFEDELTNIIENADRAKAVKRSKPKKETKSFRPLEFEHPDEDHPLKNLLIDIINSKHLTYDDLKKFSIEAFDDEVRGARFMYNTINGFRQSGGMRDDTIMLMLSFLNLKMLLVPADQDMVQYSIDQLVRYLRLDQERAEKVNDILDEISDRVSSIEDKTDTEVE